MRERAVPPAVAVVTAVAEATADDVAALVDKYAEIERLRVAHLAPDEPDPRRAMAALAARFPGALREIDELPMDEIRARLATLRHARDQLTRDEHGTALPAWILAMSAFHASARGALVAKRWLAGRKHVDDDVRAAFARAVARRKDGADAAAWVADLAQIAAPPRGRVMDVVFARLAERLGVTDDAARRLVFGEPRRERRGRSAAPNQVLVPEPPLGAAAGAAAGAAVSVFAGADSLEDEPDEPPELEPPLDGFVDE